VTQTAAIAALSARAQILGQLPSTSGLQSCTLGATAANIPWGYAAKGTLTNLYCTSATCNFASNAADRAACLNQQCGSKTTGYAANYIAKSGTGAATTACASSVCDFANTDKATCTEIRQQCSAGTVTCTSPKVKATLGAAGQVYCAGAACSASDALTCCVAKAKCSSYSTYSTHVCTSGTLTGTNDCAANECAASDFTPGTNKCCASR
jgi:hypothetical protein